MQNLSKENNELKLYIQKLKNENLQQIKNNFTPSLDRTYDSYQPSVVFEQPKYQTYFSPFPVQQFPNTPTNKQTF